VVTRVWQMALEEAFNWKKWLYHRRKVNDMASCDQNQSCYPVYSHLFIEN